MRVLRAVACTFKRTKDSDPEIGIAVLTDESVMTIVDMGGKPIKDDKIVWTYNLHPNQGCFVLRDGSL